MSFLLIFLFFLQNRNWFILSSQNVVIWQILKIDVYNCFNYYFTHYVLIIYSITMCKNGRSTKYIIDIKYYLEQKLPSLTLTINLRLRLTTQFHSNLSGFECKRCKCTIKCKIKRFKVWGNCVGSAE